MQRWKGLKKMKITEMSEFGSRLSLFVGMSCEK